VSRSRSRAKLLLTRRALDDIAAIEAHSVAEWGKRVASRYIGEIEAALVRLQEKPGLLRGEEDFHPDFCFYRVSKHLLVCDRQSGTIIVLTVIHASRDVPSRLAEMQPTLVGEVELLRQQLRARKA
jgi:plasmid stabilization system protein ParE